MKKKTVLAIVMGTTLLVLLALFVYFFPGKQGNYRTHRAITRTTKVSGLFAYNIRSDYIIEIPEEYFYGKVVHGNISWDELVAEIGEPSGTIGSGFVRKYWRIGENKYAVMNLGGIFEITSRKGNKDN